MAEATATSQQSAAVNTARKYTNQQIGVIANNLTSQSSDTATALTAIRDAILAKPAA